MLTVAATPSQTTTNSNSLPVQAGELPHQMHMEITALVKEEVKLSLYYGVMCVTTERAAELLAVETGTVRDWIKAGKLPASKPGKDYIVLLQDIHDLLNRTKVINVVRMDKRFKKRAI